MKSAQAKLMDLLAKKTYSELELRQKLALNYAEDEIEDALTHARASGWLAAPEDISDRVVEELTRKKKGHRFINDYLEQKGLPAVAEDFDAEVARARELVHTRLGHNLEADGAVPSELVGKAQRMLFSRGFSEDVIDRVLA